MSILCRMDKKNELSNLTRQDWIDQGLKVLANSGVEAVRVEPLAKLMGVTKGSFYWHFKNREDLLDSLLQAWIDQNTDGIMEQVEAAGGNADCKLLNLFELAVQNDDEPVENAIRAWARNESKVAAILDQVDQRRLDYTRDLFLQVGFTPFEAIVRARIAYYAVVGEIALGIRMKPADRLAEVRMEHAILTRRP